MSLLLNADLLNPSLRCGRYFATGSADALVSVWDANELACIKTFARLEWPVERSKNNFQYRSQVRTISFSHDGALLASASEDMRIDIGHVETTEKVDCLRILHRG